MATLDDPNIISMHGIVLDVREHVIGLAMPRLCGSLSSLIR